MTGFSLLGGPLHRWGERLGLVRPYTNNVTFGLAIGGVLWITLVALALAGGLGSQLFDLSTIGGHVRLLVVIPLFFYAESLFESRAATFVATIVRAGVVPPAAVPALDSEIARIARVKNGWVGDTVCLLAAAGLSLVASRLRLVGVTSAVEPSQLVSGVTAAGWWYWVVCLTVFRFLLLRWLWRLLLWAFFLWRLSRLDLDLVPTHPDGVGGLGYLETVHAHFAPLAAAISAIQSAGLIEELSTGRMTFEGMLPALALLLAVEALLFVAPLLIFTRKLLRSRVNGLSDYMELASTYVGRFDKKWVRTPSVPNEPLLGTSDLQALADLDASVSVVRTMRVVPASPRLFAGLGVAAAIPALPLLLFKYPLADLAVKFLSRLTGI